ncbi:MAG: HEAT repeat domain-containing protein [Candidatus Heimdallarchaeota archaeon]
MSKRLKRMSRISLFAFITIIFVSFIASQTVLGITDFDQQRKIPAGYEDAFTHTINNYKNQRFSVNCTLIDLNVAAEALLDVFVIYRDNWTDIQDGNLNLSTLPAKFFLYNETVAVNGTLLFDVNIPDWDAWIFVFLHFEAGELTAQIKLAHRHILWWMWILLPGLIIGGLVTYGIVENVTKYERARMHHEKALKKLQSRNESERKRAAFWLVSNGSKEDLEILKTMINDDKETTRESVAFSIGGISVLITDKSASKVLLDRYNIEEAYLVKEAIISALCDIVDESSIPFYTKYLEEDHNEILRYKIAQTLEKLASPKTIKVLVKTINGDNTDTLKIACTNALEVIAKKENTTAAALIKKHSSES